MCSRCPTICAASTAWSRPAPPSADRTSASCLPTPACDQTPAYAQIIVQTDTLERIAEIWPRIEAYLREELYWTDPILKTLLIGPGRDLKIEARFSGPDAAVLRGLAEEAKAIMRADPDAKEVRDDWREPVKVIRPIFNEQTIIASCNPRGPLASPLFERLRPQIEAMALPPGYHLSWGGEYEDQSKAQSALFGVLPPSFLAMVLVSILLFGKVRQPLIIWLTVPLAIIGITAGLLAAATTILGLIPLSDPLRC